MRLAKGVAAAKVVSVARTLGRAGRCAVAALGLSASGFAVAQSPASPPESAPAGGWSRVPLTPGNRVDTRPQPPKEGRKACIAVNGVAGAQMFGDSAIELTMKNGKRYRMFFATECPALSFYQGFYYRRQKAGQLCAGRDFVGARSGGECAIASIIPVRIPKR